MFQSRQQNPYKHRLLFASGILFLAALACNLPWDGGTPTAGESIGTIQKESSDVIQNAVMVETKNPLNQEDTLRVQNGGVGLLEFGDYLRLRLFNDSMVGEIEGTRIGSDPTIPLIAKMTLFAGGFSGQLFKSGSKATFTTPGGAQIFVMGTDFFVVYNQETGVTTVGNFSGIMGVIARDVSVTMASGHYLEVQPNKPPGEQKEIPWTPAEFEAQARAGQSALAPFGSIPITGDETILTPTDVSTPTPPTIEPTTPAPTLEPTTPAPTVAIVPEDCLPYNPDNLRIVDEGTNGLLLTDGSSRMLILDNKLDANDALALARRHTAHCFIGRDNTRPNRQDYIVEYWKGESGLKTTIVQRDCIPYNPDNLRIVDEGASGWLLTDGRSRMLILDNQRDAQNALTLSKRHTQQCFIGRGNTRPNRPAHIVEYWE